MTTDKTPTELDAFIETHMPAYWQYGATEQDRLRSLVRAALAKWGSPVVAGEVASHRVMRKGLDGNWVCDGKYWSDGPPSKELVESICSDKDRWRVDVAYTTPQPTNAQAGAVPLTVDEIEQLIAQWSYELHGDRARYLVRMTEKHHGIKGGQHGTE